MFVVLKSKYGTVRLWSLAQEKKDLMQSPVFSWDLLFIFHLFKV